MNLRISKMLALGLLVAAAFLPSQLLAQSTIAGTLTVNKDFSDGNTAAVTFTAACADATFEANDANKILGQASESTPAVLALRWNEEGTPECTVTETQYPGYIDDTGTACDLVALVEDGNADCTLVNTQRPVNVEINVNYTEPHPSADSDLEVDLICPTASVQTSPQTTSGGSATFVVSDFPFDGENCAAVASELPGYVVSNNGCTAVPVSPSNDNPAYSCTITLRPTEATFTVDKQFSDGNPSLAADITTLCEEGVPGPGLVYVAPGNSGQATESTDFVTTVKWFGTNSFCHASETDLVGYTQIADPGGSNCGADNDISDGNDTSCVIYNNQDPIEIHADKIYSSGGGSAVDFAVECTNLDTGGSVTPSTDSSSPGNPAVFTVNDVMYDGSTTCTVTEPTPPSGYYVSDSTCDDISLVPNSDEPRTCAITNSPTRATFRVTKYFDDGNNVDEVTVSIDCNTGLILDQDKDLSHNEWVEFVVTDFTEGTLECTITEDGQAGYSGEYENLTISGAPVLSDESCFYDSTEIVGDSAHECVITNYPDPVTVSVYKDWVFQGTTEPDINTYIEIIMSCDSEIISVDCPIYGPASDTPFETPAGKGSYWYSYCEGNTGLNDVGFVSQVIPRFPATNCSITEYVYDQAIEQDNGCGSFQVSVNNGYECVITNTVFFEGIPTLGQYGMALMALLMLGVGLVSFRRFS